MFMLVVCTILYLFGHGLLIQVLSIKAFDIMCNVCCRELIGWCKSFTKTEILLCVLQTIFLVVFVAFLTFLILHLVVCYNDNNDKHTQNSPGSIKTKDSISTGHNFDQHNVTTQTVINVTPIDAELNTHTTAVTLGKAVQCTWEPSHPTKTSTRYYENKQSSMITTMWDPKLMKNEHTQMMDVDNNEFAKMYSDNGTQLTGLEHYKVPEDANDFEKDFLMVLVKIKPPQVLTIGCTLTVVSVFWTLTAASCIIALQKADSLDSLVMMKDLEQRHRKMHPLADVAIHPQYRRVNVTFDLAALKSHDDLVQAGSLFVKLPTFIDYSLVTIGEALVVVGYGRFRNIDKDAPARAPRRARVLRVPLARCAGGGGARRGAAGPVCVTLLRARASPCHHCSGTPLLQGRLLLGVMSDNRCGRGCKPALFVNLANIGNWINSVLLN